MPAAWEISNQQRVLTVILTRETTSTAWASGFRNLRIPGTHVFLTGMPFDHARNVGCQKLLEFGWEWLFFLDDDVIAPSDAIEKLVSRNAPIISGLYYRRSPPIAPVMLRENKNERTWISEFKVPDLMPVDYVGAGCLLIHRDVLKNLPPLSSKCHWFEWRVDRADLPVTERMSEDFAFCKHARNHGYKIIMDTSVQCRHAGLGESRTGGQFIPLELV